MLSSLSEIELLQASQTGNREAFGMIVEQYQSLICTITYSITGNIAKSEELAQDAFLSAWKSLGQLKDLSKFRAWLSTITRNICTKHVEKNKRHLICNTKLLENPEQIASNEPSPVNLAIKKEQEDLVWSVVQLIPPQFREPLILYYREQQSISRVADNLGLSDDAVKQRLSRGRNYLKAELTSLVQDVIKRSKPGKTFTIALIAALPAITPQAASAAITGTVAKGLLPVKSAGLLSLIGATLGPLLGMLGVIIGIKASIKNTKSPNEHVFMKRRAWLAILYSYSSIAILLFLLWFTPQSWVLISWLILFFSGIFILAYSTERHRKAIQIKDSTHVITRQRILEMTKGQIYGEFAGAISGSLCWLYLMTVRTRDWISLWSVLIIGLVLFFASTKICLQAKHLHYQIAMVPFGIIGLMNLVIINLRWNHWMETLGPHKKYQSLSLGQMNIIIISATLLLLLIFLICVIKNRSTRKKEQESFE
jgi:RNA polymerase sigma factor (sigma-70 family)